MTVTKLKYSNTNTYLIEGTNGTILFDTGWAGTFPAFCKALGELHKSVQEIDYILISHYHPDHMGIAQEIASLGPVIVVVDVQKPFIHSADRIFEKEKHIGFMPIEDEKVRIITTKESRLFLQQIGLEGEIICTPGHSEDSISLWLDDGTLFVGDLNSLYELQMHQGTQIYDSWEKLLALKPKIIYYGHAKAAVQGDLDNEKATHEKATNGKATAGDRITEGDRENAELYLLVKRIMKYIDKGVPLEKIQKKTGAGKNFIEDVTRMYLTHQNVGVQGILDRIEIKGR